MIIYKCTNKLNGKVYIGQTIQSFEKRIGDHRRTSTYSPKDCPALYNAFKKYGFESFTWEIIHTAETLEELNEKEIFWIKEHNSVDSKFGYNCCLGGGGRLQTEEQKLRQGQISKNYWAGLSEEARLKRKEKLSISNLGRVHSKETRKKISDSNKGKVQTEEWKEKRISKLRGIKRTEEQNKVNKESHGKPILQLSLEGKFIKEFISISEASRVTKKDRVSINDCCKEKIKTSGGFIWKYKEK